MKLDSFMKLVHRQFYSADFDAVMPVFMDLIKTHHLSEEEGLWLSILYMTYYNEGSAWAAFNECEMLTIPPPYPIETNRRNLHGGRYRRHLTDLIEQVQEAGSIKSWLTQGFTGRPIADWGRAMDTYRNVWGNGRWACYTAIDIFQKVNGIDIFPTDIENAGSSGPADGLYRLFGWGNQDLQADNLLAMLQSGSMPDVPYLKSGYIDHAMLESLLCDWSGLERGLYYSGRNIDRMQERILKVEDAHNLELTELWESRKRVFDNRHLGENHGWVGIDRQRLKFYKETGRVLWSHEDR